MKILLVSHGFPPHATAGTETYTAELALALKDRGHVVEIFTTHKDISRTDLSLVDRDWRGIAVHELVNNLYYEDFRETWNHARIERAFESVLESFRPDVVHFQHLLYLSAGCVVAARARTATRNPAAVLFTLHDFWLECARFGQRVHHDGAVCHTIDFARCGTCLAHFKFGQGPIERKVGGVIASVRSGTGLNLGPLARGAAKKLSKPAANDARAEADRARSAHFEALARERWASLQTNVASNVDLFLSPSRFLRQRFVDEWGLDPARIEHLRFGIDPASFAPRARTRSEHLRVAFIGSLVPLKGPHLLLEAWGLVDAKLREQGRLVVYGPSQHRPDYQEELVSLARRVGAKLGGKLDRAGVSAALAATDLLVVPSLWYENAPLVILEALASRTPMLVSDLGGMAELVEPGVSGFHFRMGDVRDLADNLALALSGRAGLASLYARAPDLPTFAEHVDAIEARYQRFSAKDQRP